MPTTPLRENTSLWFGRYELVGKLGMGGMGELYLARQWGPEGVRRDVALKVMLPDVQHKIPDANRMFLEEMRILTGINHPNVVQIIDFGQEQGVLYMVMEYVRGVTLQELWSQLTSSDRPLPSDLVASLLGQACRGLHAAHELRDEHGQPRLLVHRDVSPQNIMCTVLGAVKLIDFGIAWAVDRLVESTRAMTIKGKLTYMAPEHLRGQPVTRSADIFAVGVILHELVTGKRLFLRDDHLATAAAILAGEVCTLRSVRPDVPQRLEDLVLSALSCDPALRPPSAAVMADELDRIVSEAGGRFTTADSVVQVLAPMGARLQPLPPAPVTETPWFIQAPRAISQKAASPHSIGDDSTALLEIVVPPVGACVERSIGTQRVVLEALEIDARSDRRPVPLELGSVILPVPLWISAPQPGLLVVEAGVQLTPDGRSRMGLYHNVDDPPERRRANIRIHGSTTGQCFHVGHRRAHLCSIRCDSVRGDGRQPPRVSLSGAPLTILARDPAVQLAVLYTKEDEETIHALCVSVL
ncbi:MAG: serine/threonine-protein kinase [Byssovorax sp.]